MKNKLLLSLCCFFPIVSGCSSEEKKLPEEWIIDYIIDQQDIENCCAYYKAEEQISLYTDTAEGYTDRVYLVDLCWEGRYAYIDSYVAVITIRNLKGLEKLFYPTNKIKKSRIKEIAYGLVDKEIIFDEF